MPVMGGGVIKFLLPKWGGRGHKIFVAEMGVATSEENDSSLNEYEI